MESDTFVEAYVSPPSLLDGAARSALERARDRLLPRLSPASSPPPPPPPPPARTWVFIGEGPAPELHCPVCLAVLHQARVAVQRGTRLPRPRGGSFSREGVVTRPRAARAPRAQAVALKSCGHSFCERCIATWLQGPPAHASCPCCRVAQPLHALPWCVSPHSGPRGEPPSRC